MWSDRAKALEAEYAPRLQALEGGRVWVEDAIGMKTPSKKHKCMHVKLQYLMVVGIIVHCDEKGDDCPFGGGARVLVDPRAGKQHAEVDCAFGGWRGFRVVPERAAEFLREWAGMHEMRISAARAASSTEGYALGLEKRDWETLTESMSNQKNKFGLLPLPPGGAEAFGSQNSWTKAFLGETPFVFRLSKGKKVMKPTK